MLLILNVDSFGLGLDEKLKHGLTDNVEFKMEDVTEAQSELTALNR